MLENPPQHVDSIPRASLVAATSAPQNLEIWMGGAHTAFGSSVTLADAQRAAIVDCAGDVPDELRTAARRFQACVFLDLDARPSAFPRLLQVIDDLLVECSRADGPQRIYAICTHGMNRSGLAAGLFLRRLGFDHETTVERIRSARPGALSNQTFVRLIGEL